MAEYDSRLSESLVRKMESIRGRGEHDKSINKLTEAHIARAFSHAVTGSEFRYGSNWYMWFNGKKYILLDEAQIKGALYDALIDLNVGDVYVVNSINKIIESGLTALARRPYNPNKGLISFRNGVLNLDTMEMTSPADESFETPTYIDFDYDPNAQCPRFRTFLSEVLPDAATQRVLQEFCGALFVDRKKYKIEKVLYLLGEGQNGKGVFLECVQHVVGRENVSSYSMYDVCTSPRRDNNIAGVNGKIVNICTDMSKADISGGEFKKFVSGEPMVGKLLFKDTFTVYDIPLAMAALNDVPKTTDHSFGHIRRHLVIPFDRRIPEEQRDPMLAAKLKEEATGILNWMFQGRARFLANSAKFSSSGVIEYTARRLKSEQDVILAFMSSKQYLMHDMPFTERFEISNEDLYQEYAEYCRRNGHNGQASNSFSINLSRKSDYSVEAVRMPNGSRGKVLYKPKPGYVYDEDTQEMVNIYDLERKKIEADKIEDDLPF
jgi:putative DNA primase/helicase